MKPVFALFAKPPLPGLSKTRLAAGVGDDRAAELASAFLTDSWNAINGLEWATALLSSTETEGFPVDAEVWQQCEGDLGAKIEHTLRECLTRGPAAFAVGADSPGMPVDRFETARMALDDADAVVGPTDDGGYYLLGLKRCPEGLLADLPWSAEDTADATIARLLEHGFTVAVLEPWWDVDEPADLTRLESLLRKHPKRAPHTAKTLSGKPR